VKDINSTLYEYVRSPSSLFYQWYCKDAEWKKDGLDSLKDLYESNFDCFFRSLNLEARLNAATTLVNEVFCPAHSWPELGFLRDALLNRELVGGMRYERYRDHTFHSFLTFLLGGFLYENSSAVRGFSLKASDQDARQRLRDDLELRTNADKGSYADFRSVMQDLFISTLFHDIGYIFEGEYDPRNPWKGTDDLSRAGSALSDCYLRAWPDKFLEGDLRMAKQLFEIIPPPSVDTKSISAAADSLRFYEAHLVGASTRADAFEMFARSNPEDNEWGRAVNALKFAYEQGSWRGIPGSQGPRVVQLDHGIVSGLVLFHLSRYFFEVAEYVDTAPQNAANDRLLATLKKNMTDVLAGDVGPFDATTRRATTRRCFAAAFHNLNPDWLDPSSAQCLSDHGMPASPFPISPDSLGLLYFPILLDNLQDWDRRRSRLDPSASSLDGLEIGCKVADSKSMVRLCFGSSSETREAADRISKSLDARLHDWRDFVEVDTTCAI
jgi:hypothetical protein